MNNNLNTSNRIKCIETFEQDKSAVAAFYLGSLKGVLAFWLNTKNYKHVWLKLFLSHYSYLFLFIVGFYALNGFNSFSSLVNGFLLGYAVNSIIGVRRFYWIKNTIVSIIDWNKVEELIGFHSNVVKENKQFSWIYVLAILNIVIFFLALFLGFVPF